MPKNKGWKKESARHSLAAKGILTKAKDYNSKNLSAMSKIKNFSFSPRRKIGLEAWPGVMKPIAAAERELPKLEKKVKELGKLYDKDTGADDDISFDQIDAAVVKLLKPFDMYLYKITNSADRIANDSGYDVYYDMPGKGAARLIALVDDYSGLVASLDTDVRERLRTRFW